MGSTWGTIQVSELRRLVDKGLTQRQIADYLAEKYGEPVGRSAVSQAMSRHGLRSARPRPTYDELIPWRVLVAHDQAYAVRMLRLEARSRLGLELTKEHVQRLTKWKRDTLHDGGLVVKYHPDTGFEYVKRREGVDGDLIYVPDDLLSEADRRRLDRIAAAIQARDRQAETGT